MLKRSLLALGLSAALAAGISAWAESPAVTPVLSGQEVAKRVLVFSKTTGFRHKSIANGVAAMQKLALEQGFEVECTEDASVFTPANLSRFRCVVFLNTSGDILNRDQEKAFEAYIQSGGGFAGVHAATDTEHTWPWYIRLVGGEFLSHGPVQKAAIEVCPEGCQHLSTSFLPKRFERTDEWYNFKRLSPTTTKILNLDENGLKEATHGKDHPVAWFHEFDGGRAWYTAGGHTEESFSEPDFLKHIAEGIRWAGHLDQKNYQLVEQKRLPADEHFETEELISNLEDPVEIAPFADGRVLVLERQGKLKLFTPGKGVEVITQLNTVAGFSGGWYEGGGLGLAIDPDFGVKNDFIYLFYSLPGKKLFNDHTAETSANRLSRFRFDGKTLSDEIPFLEVPDDRGTRVGHVAGSLCFGKDRQLFLSTGDNTCAFDSSGYNPIDEIPGRYSRDAQRSAGNSNDLRGSILRLRVNDKGDGYTIPAGNLYPAGTAKTRPEIFVKGCRNPWRIGYDSKTGGIAWGDVGPDARGPDAARGPNGYDLICLAPQAGYYGWPYFRGDNYFHDYDFAAKKSGPSFAEGIVNDSPNNTGLASLPPVQRPLAWYPYGDSEQFPEMGSGGRNADISVVYNQEGRSNSFPAWFDHVLISHDWMRCQTKLVKLDAQNRLESIHDFLPSLALRHPSDMAQDAHGNLYVLDYGTNWFDNHDGRLIKVSFAGWNRRPSITVDLAERFDSLSTEQKFSAKASDPEGKPVRATWDFGDGGQSQWDFGDGAKLDAAHTYTKPGRYEAVLTVSDADGASASRKIIVNVGNGRPEIKLALKGSPAVFKWGDELPVEVSAADAEDGDLIAAVVLSAEYGIPFDAPPAAPALIGMDPALPGGKLMVANGCIACHNATSANAGPAFSEVAKRYKDDKDRDAKLLESITKGVGGKWNSHAPMPPMGHIPVADIKTMIAAINSLGTIHSVGIPVVGGVIKTPAVMPAGLPGNSVLTLRASVSDKGAGGLPPLSGHARFALPASKMVTLKEPLTQLPVACTTLHGQEIRIDGDSIAYIHDPQLSITWEVEAPADGVYTVALEMANASTDLGRGSLSANGVSLEAKCPKTPGWLDFTKVSLGQLPLKQGRNTLVFKLNSPVAFGNLRSLSLQR